MLRTFLPLIGFCLLVVINAIIINFSLELLGNPVYYISDVSWLAYAVLALIEIHIFHRFRVMDKILNSVRNYFKD